jgi:hypothetical protein
MRDLLCIALFFAGAACVVTALASIAMSTRETAPGTSTWTALTRGAFLHRKHFTERGWRLRTRAVRFQLLALALAAVFFFTCAEF